MSDEAAPEAECQEDDPWKVDRANARMVFALSRAIAVATPAPALDSGIMSNEDRLPERLVEARNDMLLACYLEIERIAKIRYESHVR